MKTFTLITSFILSTSLFASNDCSEKKYSVTESEFEVKLSSYLRADSKNHIMIIPPTGGANFIDRSWGRNFCAAGFNAHIVEHWTDDAEMAYDLGIHQRFYSRTQKAIGLVLNHLKDASYIGMMGTSIGGIHTAMAMGIHEPLRLPRKFEGKDLGMIVAKSDTTVPYDNQIKLKNHWKPKTLIEYSNNHFWGIVLSWLWDSKSVIKFFEESASKKRL